MHSHAGQRARPEDLVDLDALTRAYFETHPDASNPGQRVAFGTSGHRGSSLDAAFNEDHILAITQAIVEYRADQGVTGQNGTAGARRRGDDRTAEAPAVQGCER